MAITVDGKRVRDILSHYRAQTEEETVGEDEGIYREMTETIMEIPLFRPIQ